MTTIVIDDKKEGAQEMLDLMRVLGFVNSIETSSENEFLHLKRQKLVKFPQHYDPLALAGSAEGFELDLVQIRKEWTKLGHTLSYR